MLDEPRPILQVRKINPKKAYCGEIQRQSVPQLSLNSVYSFGCAGSSLPRGLSSSCGERGLPFAVVCGLTAVASLIAKHGRWGPGAVAVACALGSCGSRALEPSFSSYTAQGLSCSACGIFPDGDQTHVSCAGRRILYG